MMGNYYPIPKNIEVWLVACNTSHLPGQILLLQSINEEANSISFWHTEAEYRALAFTAETTKVRICPLNLCQASTLSRGDSLTSIKVINSSMINQGSQENIW
ncbi:hypothetical protein M9H77_36127 [Catharanthus roseus]|uniref:Uncharacterized protein n=1 Tax=Catharanthus roseus TaxID=4058 RepID=A0ACB9ZQY1_CATRO|nr:hypothetical protein M9H77_36127 [Catharanthus roseus]